MSLKDTVEPFEEYSRGYVFYLLSFLGGHRGVDDPPPTLNDGKQIVYVIISAFFTALLQGMVDNKLNFTGIAFPELVILRLCFWIVLCAVLHSVLSTKKNHVDITTSASIMLHVAPVSAVFAAFLSFLFYSALYSLWGESWTAETFVGMFYLATGVLELLLIGVLLLGQLRKYEGVSRFRRLLSVVTLVVFVGVLQWVIVAGSFGDPASTAGMDGAAAPVEGAASGNGG